MPIFEYICKECHHQFETLLYGKEKGAATVGVRRVGKGLVAFGLGIRVPIRRVRILRRSPWPGRLLAGRYELGVEC